MLLALPIFIGLTNYRPNTNPNYEAYQWPVPWNWIFSSAFWTAVFTGVLTISTYLLWRETKRLARGAETQREQLDLSIAAAQKAANAAELSAKAAVGVELPILNIETLGFTHPLPKTEQDYESWCSVTSPFIKVRNHGRTPAFVSSVIVNAKVDEIPLKPSYETIHPYFDPLIIEAGALCEYTERLFSARSRISWTDVQVARRTADDRKLHIWTRIEFTDFLGGKHSTAGIFVWNEFSERYDDWGVMHPDHSYRT